MAERTVSSLPTGYEGQNVPEDFFIPKCTVEDVDRSMFELFDKRLPLQIAQNGTSQKVPVIFAGGERFAIRRNKPYRDKNGTLILPLISIRRMSIDQSRPGPYGRSMGVDTGDIIIKKRLDESDRNYQNIINKMRLSNQLNVSDKSHFEVTTGSIWPGENAVTGTLASRRNEGNLSFQLPPTNLLGNSPKKNIFEIITIPYPMFYTVSYSVTVWSQYITHMNQIVETIVSSYDGQGNQFKLTTPKNYWFVGYVGGDLTSEENFDDYMDKERIIKYNFTIDVPAYFMASSKTSGGTPFRKYFSAPQIVFETDQIRSDVSSPSEGIAGSPDKFLLSPVGDIDLTGEPVPGSRRGTERTRVRDIVQDPFSGKKESRYVKISNRYQRRGESIGSLRQVTKLEER